MDTPDPTPRVGHPSGSAPDCVAHIMAQRQEIMTAFLAKYGYEPDRVLQIEKLMPDGTRAWLVRRISDDEMKLIALAPGAGLVDGGPINMLRVVVEARKAMMAAQSNEEYELKRVAFNAVINRAAELLSRLLPKEAGRDPAA